MEFHVKERKNEMFCDVFLSAKVTKPPYYAIALAHSWPLDQKHNAKTKPKPLDQTKTNPLEITLKTS